MKIKLGSIGSNTKQLMYWYLIRWLFLYKQTYNQLFWYADILQVLWLVGVDVKQTPQTYPPYWYTSRISVTPLANWQGSLRLWPPIDIYDECFYYSSDVHNLFDFFLISNCSAQFLSTHLRLLIYKYYI